ncbi:hypothetical protein Back11_59060 [Paenibacillus baekrokdamisoli]|uniref:Uncharacterized protein n=1 Tax=Paenibacillus baekrokdamisoli TaxID=1712516 RepID=A0A3G9JF80_9BACL|nr:carbohydrate ABC transporter permease [Paenibacillus baekrokdamisoli]MBB3071405.1 multiple sugar transport system permease protein [Paenibacillus baekrokdamisoli]BBH24561.1 hypothetical protein Back11_59060 [Paenibacillus baekrokdamisoli]
MKSNRIREKGAVSLKVTAYIITIVFIAVSLIPLAWMLSSSLKDGKSIYSLPPKWIPSIPQTVSIMIDYSGNTAGDDKSFYELEAAKATWFTWRKFQNEAIGEMHIIGTKDGKKIFEATTPSYLFTAGKPKVVPAQVFTDEMMKLKLQTIRDSRYTKYTEYAGGVSLDKAEEQIVREGSVSELSTGNQMTQIAGFLKESTFMKGSLQAIKQTDNWARLFDNYRVIWKTRGGDSGVGLLTYIGNSLFVTTATILLHIMIGGMASYALSRLVSKKWGIVLTMFFVATIMIPEIAVLVPLYLTIVKLGLVDTLWGIILPHSAWGIIIFLFKGFFDQLPGELLQAARIDGSSEYRIYFTMIIPLSLPIFTTVSVMSFMGTWNEFLWPLVVARKEEVWTLTVALNDFTNNQAMGPQIVMSTLMIATIPLLIVFASCQKLIERGVAWTGVKG